MNTFKNSGGGGAENSSNTNNNELSLVGGYIKLFAEVVVVDDDAQQRRKRAGNDKPSPNIDTDTNTTNVVSSTTSRDYYWVHDKWNEFELNQAKKTLEDNFEKCWISDLDRNNKIGIGNIKNNNNNNKNNNNDDGSVWDRFYENHGTRFFKDRHYLERAFPEDFYYYEYEEENNNNNNNTTTTTASSSAAEEGNRIKTLVEIGCGVGNAILPMMDDERQQQQQQQDNNIVSGETKKKKIRWDIIHGVDISKEAISLMKNDPRFVKAHTNQRAFGYVCDITQTVPKPCIESANVTTLLFCLSAIDPDNMPAAVKNVASILKRGGTLLFRDYGRYDEAQMKLGCSRGKCLKDNFYRKHDGTKCYYFTLADLKKLFTDVAGLHVLELEYLQRLYDNHKSGEKRRRVWVHGRFLKP